MNEVLFSESAKHYLLSTDITNETILVTVSPSEVNVLIRYAAPDHPVETNIIAQSTVVDESTFTILLKQVNRVIDMEQNDNKELAHIFLNRIDENLSLVQKRRTAEEDGSSIAVNNLRKGIADLRSQVQ